MSASERPGRLERDGWIGYRSANPFEFSQILAAPADAAEQAMFGWLLLPENAPERVPVVVCLHGSMGWRGHHHEHMVRWLEAGIGVFRVHSFEARRVVSVVEDQMAVTSAMLLNDAYRALELLTQHTRVIADRVGITGWSLGGSAALYAGYEPLREALVGADGPRFAAHLPFYPAAHVQPQEQRWTSAPILTLSGGADDYTPAHFVTQLIELAGDSANMRAVIYPDAHHSFDSVEPLTWLPDAIRLGKNPTLLEKDGRMVAIGASGKRYDVSDPSGRREVFAKKRTLGAHIGGDWDARRRSFADGEAFFREFLLGDRV